MTLLDQYAALMDEWLDARARAGGALTEAEDAEWCGRLDDVYWQMSPAEQTASEERARELATAHAAADEEAGPAVGAGEAHERQSST